MGIGVTAPLQETLNKMTRDEFIIVLCRVILENSSSQKGHPLPFVLKILQVLGPPCWTFPYIQRGGVSDDEAHPDMTAKSTVSSASQIPFI